MPNDLPMFQDSALFEAEQRGASAGRAVALAVLLARPARLPTNPRESDLFEVISTRAEFDALEAELPPDQLATARLAATAATLEGLVAQALAAGPTSTESYAGT